MINNNEIKVNKNIKESSDSPGFFPICQLNVSTKYILAKIIELSNRYPTLYISQKKLADMTGYHRVSINKALSLLRDLGLIWWDTHHERKTNIYRLTGADDISIRQWASNFIKNAALFSISLLLPMSAADRDTTLVNIKVNNFIISLVGTRSGKSTSGLFTPFLPDTACYYNLPEGPPNRKTTTKEFEDMIAPISKEHCEDTQFQPKRAYRTEQAASSSAPACQCKVPVSTEYPQSIPMVSGCDKKMEIRSTIQKFFSYRSSIESNTTNGKDSSNDRRGSDCKAQAGDYPGCQGSGDLQLGYDNRRDEDRSELDWGEEHILRQNWDYEAELCAQNNRQSTGVFQVSDLSGYTTGAHGSKEPLQEGYDYQRNEDVMWD